MKTKVLTTLIFVLCILMNPQFSEGSGKWLNYTKGNSVLSLALDGEGYLWCGTHGGVAKIDMKTGEKVVYTRADGLADNIVIAEAIDPDGSKWFGTEYGGVSVLREDGIWETYNPSNSGLADYCVVAIAIDPDGNRWFGTWYGGVSVLRKDGIWETYNTLNSGLADNYVLAIAIDIDGGICLGLIMEASVFYEKMEAGKHITCQTVELQMIG